MHEIRIQSFSKYKIWHPVIFFVGGLIILSMLLYDYALNQLDDDWYTSLFVGGFIFIYGFGEIIGWIEPYVSEIVVDGDGIRTNTTELTYLFRWCKFKKVELNKKRVEVQFAATGLKSSFNIPFLIRIVPEKMQRLETAIFHQCELHSIPFESNI